MVAMMWNSGCHSPALRFRRDRGVRHDVAVDLHVVRAGGAHAERAPGIEYLHVRRVHRHAEMQHHRRLAVVFVDRAGHQQVADRRAGGEDLARGDAIAALDLLGLAGAARSSPSRRSTAG